MYTDTNINSKKEKTMQNRTTAIILTVISAAVCGCFGLIACIFGGLIAAGTPFNVTSNGYTGAQTFPVWIGIALLCLAVLFIAVPVVVGVLTLRKKKTPVPPPPPMDVLPPQEPLPPAS
jgi:uncharacterized membrane protein YhdT